MYHSRALRILGIDDEDGLTRTELRRIYLRKLKHHPPEKDPDRFRELREAFELLRDYVADDPEPREAPAVVVFDASAIDAPPKAPVFAPPSATTSASVPVVPVAPPVVPLTPPIATAPPITPPVAPVAPPIAAPPVVQPPVAPIAPPVAPVAAPVPPRDSPRPPIESPPPIEPPRPRLPPLAPRSAEPPLPLAQLVARLCELLAGGLVDAARALERDWRAKTAGDEFREATGLLGVRWLLLRELLGVVGELPVPVIKILAKALAEGDLSSARLSLIVYGREHPIEAELAADALAKRAPNLFKPIENTLHIPKPKPTPLVPGGVFNYGLDFMRAMADKNKKR